MHTGPCARVDLTSQACSELGPGPSFKFNMKDSVPFGAKWVAAFPFWPLSQLGS